jgi:hypothetical protein
MMVTAPIKSGRVSRFITSSNGRLPFQHTLSRSKSSTIMVCTLFCVSDQIRLGGIYTFHRQGIPLQKRSGSGILGDGVTQKGAS